jgi:2-hydroxy-6-oxonona-2,4-dienedioate hydrolase
MMRRFLSLGGVIGVLLASLGAAIFTAVFLSYRRDIRRARKRISVGSRIAETRSGPIEYAIAGNGPPLLVVHGAGGGFDQGLDFAEPLVQKGFRVIAMSRFGYLRTPLPADASAAAQADAHACLLDELHIERAAVVGASAGAPSSIQFALRHPERTAALVLMVPAIFPRVIERRPAGALPKQTSSETGFLFDTALKSDLLFWLAPKIMRRTMIRAILATPPSVVEHATAEERARAATVLEHILPVSTRRLGLVNDAVITSSVQRYELERIAAPTLIVGAVDDLFGTCAGARHAAQHIPGARLVEYPVGGHLWVGHQQEVIGEIESFLRNAT